MSSSHDKTASSISSASTSSSIVSVVYHTKQQTGNSGSHHHHNRIAPLSTISGQLGQSEDAEKNGMQMVEITERNASLSTKFECELCLEPYSSYDRKPTSLVPCGHSLCIRCFDNLNKTTCPFCRTSFIAKIPNWEIMKRLPKPNIPILFYQVEIKLNLLKNATLSECQKIVKDFNTSYRQCFEKFKQNSSKKTTTIDETSKTPKMETLELPNYGDKTLLKLNSLEKKLNVINQENVEISDLLQKRIDKFSTDLNHEENKYNEENLKKIRTEIDSVSKLVRDRMSLWKRELEGLNALLDNESSNNNLELVYDFELLSQIEKNMEHDYNEKTDTTTNAQNLLTLLTPLPVTRPSESTAEQDSNEAGNFDPLENLRCTTSQKMVTITIISLITLILMSYPVAMVIVGSVYKNDCPANYLIPTWLIVFGTGTIASQIIFAVIFCYLVFRAFRQRSVAEKLLYVFLLIIPFIVILVFNLAWFFTGNAWIYPIYRSVQFTVNSSDLSNYCHQTLYMFSFWTLNVCYILFGLFVLVANLICCCVCLFKK